MKALTARVDTLDSNAAIAAGNTAEILDFLKGAKTISGYARKWGPRLLTFAIGVAIAKGWITAENGASFSHIFGL